MSKRSDSLGVRCEMGEFRDAADVLLDRARTGETGEAGTEWWSSRANSNSCGDGKEKTSGEETELVVMGRVWGFCWSTSVVWDTVTVD